MNEHLDNPLPPAVTGEARRLRGELDLVTKSRDAWEEEARRAKSEAAAQRDERHADWLRLANENLHLKAQIGRLEVELERTHADLDEAAATNLRHTKAAEISRDFLAGHEAEIQRLKAELSAVGLARSQACEDLGDAAAEVDRLNEQIDSERLGYKREVGRLKAELAQAKDQAARAEAELYGQGQYLDSARAEVEDLHAAIEARDKEIANLRAKPATKPQAPVAAPALDIAVCVRLLAVADPADLEPVVRTVARLLRGGGVS